MPKKRRDAVQVTDLDGYHKILPYIMPKRTEAEVSLTESFDVTELNEYMKKRNEEDGTNLKLFHAICTAIARTVYHRPLMNRFIAGRLFWQRKDITLSFVCKQKFEDDALETLMFLKVKPDMNLDSISHMILGDTKKARQEKGNDLDDLMNTVGNFPRFILEIFFGILRRLEYHGIMPKGLTTGDPNYSSVLISNLGSIKAGAPYHHLSEYGTCSVMITIGTMHKADVRQEDGSYKTRDLVDMTFNIDERIADGFYFAKSLRLAKYMLANPEVLMESVEAALPIDEICK